MSEASRALKDVLAANQDMGGGPLLSACGAAIARKAPSTSGTLVATGFLRAAKAVTGTAVTGTAGTEAGGTEAVSYTHLDVYKRQGPLLVIRPSTPFRTIPPALGPRTRAPPIVPGANGWSRK